MASIKSSFSKNYRCRRAPPRRFSRLQSKSDLFDLEVEKVRWKDELQKSDQIWFDWDTPTDFIPSTSKRRTYFYVCLIDGMASYFPDSYATTRNRTYVSSLNLYWGTLIQDALPNEVPRPRHWLIILITSQNICFLGSIRSCSLFSQLYPCSFEHCSQ